MVQNICGVKLQNYNKHGNEWGIYVKNWVARSIRKSFAIATAKAR